MTSVVAGPCPSPVTRAGAEPGDEVWVTGTPGLAGAGWMWDDPPPAALDALRRPHPRLAFVDTLAGFATAAMDLSDGLASDLPRLAAASAVAVYVALERLPVAPALARVPVRELRTAQLTGGEDYELLFTAAPAAHDELIARARAAGVPLTCIGSVSQGGGVSTSEGPLPQPGFAHFDLGAARP